MEEGHGHSVACGGVCDREGFVKPDTVFGARAASITALHMAVAKARVETYPQWTPMARCCSQSHDRLDSGLDHGRVIYIKGRADALSQPVQIGTLQGICSHA